MSAERAIEVAARLFDTRHGWAWVADPVEGAPGWHHVHQRGDEPLDVLIGGMTLVGPRDVVVHLSANPFIHDDDVTTEVLNELGGTLDGVALSEEIARRTSVLRAAAASTDPVPAAHWRRATGDRP